MVTVSVCMFLKPPLPRRKRNNMHMQHPPRRGRNPTSSRHRLAGCGASERSHTPRMCAHRQPITNYTPHRLHVCNLERPNEILPSQAQNICHRTSHTADSLSGEPHGHKGVAVITAGPNCGNANPTSSAQSSAKSSLHAACFGERNHRANATASLCSEAPGTRWRQKRIVALNSNQ